MFFKPRVQHEKIGKKCDLRYADIVKLMKLFLATMGKIVKQCQVGDNFFFKEMLNLRICWFQSSGSYLAYIQEICQDTDVC